MCSFYKKFVPECNNNFELLKEKLQKSPVLISPDFKKPYIIQTDASNKGLFHVILATLKVLATLSLKKWIMNYDPSNLVVEF